MKKSRKPTIDRLISKCYEGSHGCWIFGGYIMPEGYGQVRGDDGRAKLTHRVTYEHFRGDIPDRLVLDHLCRTRACCNPWHVEPVPQRENIKRGNLPLSAGWQLAAANLAKSHCPHGHPYSPENTYVTSKGHRQCRKCKAIREAARKKAAAA